MEVMQPLGGGGSVEDLEDDLQYTSHDSLYLDPEEEAARNHQLLYEECVEYTGSVFEDDSEEEDFGEEDGTEKELRNPIKGFDKEEKTICPLVDRKSAILFDIVQALEDTHLAESIRMLQKYNTPIVFPRELLEDGGSMITMKICTTSASNTNREDQVVEEQQDLDLQDQSRPDEECIIEMELAEQQKLLGDPEYAVATFTPPFDYGWVRELVVRVHQLPDGAQLGEYPLTSIGEVFYRDPEGNKIRSMKQIALSLEKCPLPGVSIKNFTFAKGPIGINDPRREVIRRITSKGLPVIPSRNSMKVAKKPGSIHSDSSRNGSVSGDHSIIIAKLKGNSPQRALQSYKRNSSAAGYMHSGKRAKYAGRSDYESELDEDMDTSYQHYNEGYGGDYNGSDNALIQQFTSNSLFTGFDDHAEAYEEDMGNDAEMLEPTKSTAKGELLPCSIRCPGMAEIIPTLGCTGCHCLYHPECLGLSPNVNHSTFLCANCENEPLDIKGIGNSSKSTSNMPFMKTGDTGAKMKKPPPPLLPAFSKPGSGSNLKGKLHSVQGKMSPSTSVRNSSHQSSQRSSLLKSQDSVSITAVSMKKGKVGVPKEVKAFSNSIGKNLTITPISMRPHLPVPNLAPMNKGKGNALALPKLKPGQYQGQVQNSKGRLSLPPLKDVSKSLKPLIQSPLSMMNKGPGGFPAFKSYQSIVRIGTKKFVAVPKCLDIQYKKGIPKRMNIGGPAKITHSAAEKLELGTKHDETEEAAEPHPLLFSKDVMEKVFKFLDVKDLSRTSRVCRLWNEFSTKPDLWKLVKLKNQRISNVESFASFLKKRGTETIDFRKMISADDMDWDYLFVCLGEVDSLNEIVIGPRTVPLDRVSELHQHCPNVKITQ